MRTRLPRRLALLAGGVVVAATLTAPTAQAAEPDVETVREEVAQLGREVEAASAEYLEVEARLAAQQSKVTAADVRVASQATLVTMLEEQVVDLAVETYKTGGVDPQLSLLATGSTGLAASSDMLGRLAERRAVTLGDVRAAQGELERLRVEAQAELESLQAMQADLAQRRADIEARLAGAQDILAVAEAEAQRQLALDEARKAAAASRNGGADVTLPPVGSGLLETPTSGRQSAYGWRTHPVYGDRRFHSGMDIMTGCGTPVVAAEDGIVQSASWNGSYGNIMVVRHGDSDGGELSTAYAHLSEFAASPGDVVARGEVIAYVGTTGLSTGCHLHFEVRIDGEDVDPARFI